MHDKRIMHRDLKPANIFIASDDTLKLGDLGLGRYFGSQTFEAFSKVGTPLYMSPEVLQNNGYDWKSDVWSLGCIGYELACLHSPFRCDNAKMSLYELFQRINKGQYPPIHSKYSDELKWLMDAMLKHNPTERISMDNVVQCCEKKLEFLRMPKIDHYLIMDDINEKLHLLNYEKEFCHNMNRKPITRVYFAYADCLSEERFNYFYELCYWLMSYSEVSM